ncbi:hypothetical protein P4E94_12960 [Pontiellaceae bacterium B12219]|nr:hypothetical protein [Pontiellaceae bacterium B1224]MDF7808357.1 hypothetical protein [Pontiellaceae bacterium B12219]
MMNLKQTMTLGSLLVLAGTVQAGEWKIETQEEWLGNTASQSSLEITDGKAAPTAVEATFQSVVKRFPEKRSAKTITFSQSPDWLNWTAVPNVGPGNMGDAPVALQLGDGNYWMFGRYGQHKSQKDGSFKAEPATLDGYDIELMTTPHKNQFDAPGGLQEKKGGYHAWHSKDMTNWVHHGAITEHFSRWMTTAEVVDGTFYFYYDFPNDQDPHLYLDDNLEDGKPGEMMGMVFKDPSHGSDCAVIRELDGTFHIIAEDWSPIKASVRSWDSPLAIRGVSPDGIKPFEVQEVRPVDNRTNPTGKIGTYKHPHWAKEDPKNYKTSVAEYEIHEPEQEAYGDWALINIGGQYYMFGDFDKHEGGTMSTCWFTSDSLEKEFTWCGDVGKGHPDPEILFAENQFYMLTQQKVDQVSPGPWVETVEVRVGVDTSNDGKIDQWSDWQTVSEQYDYIEGFSRQVAKTAAQMDLSVLPEGYGFQFEVKMTDTTENESKPVLDNVVLSFGE